ncbi:hypothetical protein PUN28_010219 [Cardiocondyla obscurior]|uniref:Uncharacterized protein n=1 Tax=Cardiocondyla obscurior TaxID=286306 RepID=A0AAW2FR16_9HYME
MASRGILSSLPSLLFLIVVPSFSVSALAYFALNLFHVTLHFHPTASDPPKEKLKFNIKLCATTPTTVAKRYKLVSK